MDLVGLPSINGGPFQSFSANGTPETEAFGKVGNVLGTFNTEWLSMNLSGTSPFGAFMIREGPTLASTGQTSITDLGGGLYRIDSFFDLFKQLSIDGGATWMPADGPAHILLTPSPEPTLCALAGLRAGLLALRAARRLRK